MVNLVPAKCPSCGASLELDDNLKRTECKYCKTTIIVDDAIAKYKLEISGNVKVNGIQDDDDKLEIVNNYLKLGEIETARDLMNQALAKNPFNFKILNTYIKTFNFDKLSDDITVQNIHEEIKQANIGWGNGCLSDKDLIQKLKNFKLSENKEDKELYEMVSKKLENIQKVSQEYYNIENEIEAKIKNYVLDSKYKVIIKNVKKILTSLEVKEEDINKVINYLKEFSYYLYGIYPEYIPMCGVDCKYKTSKNIVEIKQIIDNVIDNDKGLFSRLFK